MNDEIVRLLQQMQAQQAQAQQGGTAAPAAGVNRMEVNKPSQPAQKTAERKGNDDFARLLQQYAMQSQHGGGRGEMQEEEEEAEAMHMGGLHAPGMASPPQGMMGTAPGAGGGSKGLCRW